MSKADDYRRKAAECMGRRRGHDRSQCTYLDLAKQWVELARQAETLDRQRKS